MLKEKVQFSKSIITAGVIVAALGYFVDIYDLVLFSIVRKASLGNLGFSAADIENNGLWLLNAQMLGMLFGGLLWGIVGDKRGRLSVLFGSILLYSLANIMNGFASGFWDYLLFRIIAGIGLAGELGAGITLITESLPKEKRGWGTMIVATIGVSGAVFAGFMYKFLSAGGANPEAWRTCYFIGGALGLALLIMRIGVYESGMFKQMQDMEVEKGNLLMLVNKKERFLKYVNCILLGIPTWYIVGILVTFSPEFSKVLRVQGEPLVATAIMFTYGGITIGDFLSGFLSQMLKSRKKVMLGFLLLTGVSIVLFFSLKGLTLSSFYLLCGFMGFSTGFWAIVVTNAAEQFGTNLRATVATSVPNFIRGSLFLITLGYVGVSNLIASSNGLPSATCGECKLQSAAIIGVFIVLIPLIALYFTNETFGKDLDYVEE
jgi:putative MFS transporter